MSKVQSLLEYCETHQYRKLAQVLLETQNTVRMFWYYLPEFGVHGAMAMTNCVQDNVKKAKIRAELLGDQHALKALMDAYDEHYADLLRQAAELNEYDGWAAIQKLAKSNNLIHWLVIGCRMNSDKILADVARFQQATGYTDPLPTEIFRTEFDQVAKEFSEELAEAQDVSVVDRVFARALALNSPMVKEVLKFLGYGEQPVQAVNNLPALPTPKRTRKVKVK